MSDHVLGCATHQATLVRNVTCRRSLTTFKRRDHQSAPTRTPQSPPGIPAAARDSTARHTWHRPGEGGAWFLQGGDLVRGRKELRHDRGRLRRDAVLRAYLRLRSNLRGSAELRRRFDNHGDVRRVAGLRERLDRDRTRRFTRHDVGRVGVHGRSDERDGGSFTAPPNSGSYVARAFLNDTLTPLAESTSFTVTR
jgi:hypothetical protein